MPPTKSNPQGTKRYTSQELEVIEAAIHLIERDGELPPELIAKLKEAYLSEIKK
jgi:hypothetical protein